MERAETVVSEDNFEVQNARVDEEKSHFQSKRECIKRYPKTVGWSLVMMWIMIVVGFDNQAGGAVLSVPQFRKNFGIYYDDEYILTARWQSAIQGGPTAVTVTGLLSGSFLADIFGKRIIITLGLCISIIGIGIEFSAQSIAVFFTGKMINGFALGIFLGLCLAYTAEIAPLPIRGISTGLMNIAQCIGPFLGSIMVNYVGDRPNNWSYKSLIAAQWGFNVPGLVVQLFMPESPWYLIRKGRDEEAKKVYKRLCSHEEDIESRFVAAKITIQEAEELASSSNFIECFKGTNLRRTLIACLAFFCHPMSGVSFIGSYGAYIYQLIGITAQESFRIGIGGQVLSISGNFFGFYVIDKFGRRPLIMTGVICLMIDLLILASTGTAVNKPSVRTACVAFLTMYNFFYNGGIGNVAYTIASEVPTAKLRTKTITIAISQYQALNCMWTFVLPYIINPNEGDLEAKVGFIFFALLFICLTLLYFFMPEIKSRTYEELDDLFSHKVSARKFSKYITEPQMKNERAYEVKEKSQEVEHVDLT